MMKARIQRIEDRVKRLTANEERGPMVRDAIKCFHGDPVAVSMLRLAAMKDSGTLTEPCLLQRWTIIDGVDYAETSAEQLRKLAHERLSNRLVNQFGAEWAERFFQTSGAER